MRWKTTARRPDTQDAIWEYPGFTVEGSLREASGGRSRGGGGTASSLAGVQFCGTKGILAASRGGYEFAPDMKIAPESAIPPWSKPPGHPKDAGFHADAVCGEQEGLRR